MVKYQYRPAYRLSNAVWLLVITDMLFGDTSQFSEAAWTNFH